MSRLDGCMAPRKIGKSFQFSCVEAIGQAPSISKGNAHYGQYDNKKQINEKCIDGPRKQL